MDYDRHKLLCRAHFRPCSTSSELVGLLPGVLWGKIVSFFTDIRDIVRFRRACTQFNAIGRCSVHTISLDHCRTLNAEVQAATVRQYPNAQHITLHNRYRDIADRDIATVAAHCPLLRTLIITQLHCTQRIESDPRSDDSGRVSSMALRALAYHCPLLEVFSFPGTIGWVQDGVNALALCCPSLRSLTLQLSERWRLPRELHNLPLLTGLKHLDLRATETDIRSTRVLAKCEPLRSFSLLFPAGQKPVVGVTHLAWSTLLTGRGPTLQRLALAGLRDSVALEFIAKFCGQLRRLSLSGSNVCTDAAVQAVVEANPHLTELDLSFTNVEERTVSAIKKLTALQSLALCHCPLLSYTHLLDVVQTRGPTLRALEMGDHYMVLAEKLIHTVSVCSSLRRLSLVNCVFGPEELTDAVCALSRLTHLHIRVGAMQSSLTDKTARRIIAACPSLVCLSLPGHPVTTRTAQAAARLSSLAALDLSCADIGDVAMEALATCSSLQVLRVGGTYVGDSGVYALLAGCPRLRFMEVFECKVTPAAVSAAGVSGVAVMHERPMDEQMLSVADFIAEEPHPSLVWDL